MDDSRMSLRWPRIFVLTVVAIALMAVGGPSLSAWKKTREIRAELQAAYEDGRYFDILTRLESEPRASDPVVQEIKARAMAKELERRDSVAPFVRAFADSVAMEYSRSYVERARTSSLEPLSLNLTGRWESYRLTPSITGRRVALGYSNTAVADALSRLVMARDEYLAWSRECAEIVQQSLSTNSDARGFPLDSLAKSACQELALDDVARDAIAKLDARAATIFNRLYQTWSSLFPAVTSFASVCPKNVNKCNYRGSVVSWPQFRELRNNASELEIIVDKAQDLGGQAKVRLENWLATADRYRTHMLATNQVSSSVRENLAAERWYQQQRDIWERNQRINDSIVAEKMRRTPAQRDSVRREICNQLGIANCPR